MGYRLSHDPSPTFINLSAVSLSGLQTLTVKSRLLPGEKHLRAAGNSVAARHFMLRKLNEIERQFAKLEVEGANPPRSAMSP